MIALLVLAVVGVALFAAFVGAACYAPCCGWCFLPFRLLFALLLLPFLLVKAIVGALFFLVAGPLVAVLGHRRLDRARRRRWPFRSPRPARPLRRLVPRAPPPAGAGHQRTRRSRRG